jgi:hypothetical protein
MNYIILTILLLFGPSHIEVPQEVKSCFTLQYEDVDIDFVNWEKKWDNYKASYTDDMTQLKMEVYISKFGKWMYTKEEALLYSVPDNVMDSFSSKYSNSKIIGIKKIIRPKKPVVYEFEIKIFNFQKYVYYDTNGRPVEIKLK